MAVNLPNELQKFSSQASRLRQIFEETKKCFDDINTSGNFDGTQIIQAILLQEEEAEITDVVERPPTVVVFGQTPYARSRIVNELFGKKVLPSLETEDSETRFRMVRFKHGDSARVSLTLPDDYDLVDTLEADSGPWHTIPRRDLVIFDDHLGPDGDTARGIAHLEVTQNHPLLHFGTHVVVAPSVPEGLTEEVVKQCVEHIPSILVYGFSSDQLHDRDVQDLSEIGKVTSFQPVCFVRVPPPGSSTVDTDPPDGGTEAKATGCFPMVGASKLPPRSSAHGAEGFSSGLLSQTEKSSCPVSADLRRLLCRLGYLPGSEGKYRRALTEDYYSVESIFVERFNEFLPMFTKFSRQICQACLVNAATVLNNSHTRCLRMFILSAFDMARDMLITPKKLEFVREKEEELYKSLLAIAVSKITEIKDMISETIVDISESVKEECAAFDLSPYGIGEDCKASTRVAKQCMERIQELVLSHLNNSVAGKLVSSVNILRDSYTGTLTRCLESLEEQTSDSPEEIKTTVALKQILNTAYEVEITVRSSSSLIKSLLEKMKQLVQSMPWKSAPVVDSEWKRKVAAEMLSGLSEARLARSIASQIKDRLNKSHEMFAVSLKQLEARHTGRLDRIEEQRLKLRKVHAPRLAKLALESTSLRDTILYGMPQMGREIGRGQYGVVYSCDSWAKYSPVAIKSVVPPDDKHWNDLALEFFYTKWVHELTALAQALHICPRMNIPEHPRIVALRGSVIDYMYGGGMSPAVLLVMDRLQKDLYTAIKQGLEWHHRLQVAIDVVEGLRYLHSQGLVHRDVKLKNVLLDKDCRGKITDLGFCKPEAMMSGSIVGTPIHMAPELFTGQYDNSVDVYAFGILFWYVCAGHVHLPSAFEQCANKDQLWQSVKKGLRPERLPVFSDACWDLMQRCWVGEPKDRPFFGDVQTQLQHILDKVRRKSGDPGGASSSGKDKVVHSRHIRVRANHFK